SFGSRAQYIHAEYYVKRNMLRVGVDAWLGSRRGRGEGVADRRPPCTSILDHERPRHVLVPVAAEDVAKEIELARLFGREGDARHLARIDIGTHVEGRQLEAVQAVE